MIAGTSGGSRLGRFELGDVLGSGGMGKVYRAWDPEIAAPVALKTLLDLGPEQLYRIKQEFRTVREIRHPNLVRLYDLFVEDGTAFFTMELLEGSTFGAWLNPARKGKTPTDEEVIGLFLQFADGVAVLHHAGILHRDIKPGNAFVTREGRLVLLDFGLSRLIQSDLSIHDEEAWVGTFRYMAPELLRGGSPSPASDWYSLGVVMAEAFVGGRALPQDPLSLYQAKQGPLPPDHFSVLERELPGNPGLPPGLADLLQSLLDINPERRPGYADIRRMLGAPGKAPPPPASAGTERRTLVGRGAEIALLEAAFAEARAGALRAIVFRGPGGMGKSALVGRFCESQRRGAPCIVLDGKCNVYESIPYKALDPVIDRLSRILAGLPVEARAVVAQARDGAFAAAHPSPEGGRDIRGMRHGALRRRGPASRGGPPIRQSSGRRSARPHAHGRGLRSREDGPPPRSGLIPPVISGSPP